MIEDGGRLARTGFVSVVVPMRNERDAIERCLRALAEQDLGADRLEVLVVDGMSDDGSRQVVEAWAARDPRFRVVDNPARVTPVGMNLGLRAARGEVLVLVGAHSEVAPDFLRRSLEALDATGADAVGGVLESVGTTRFGRIVAGVLSSRFGVGDAGFRVGAEAGETDTVVFGAYRRKTVEKHGLLDEELVRNQDDEWNMRIREGGGRLWLDPKIRSRYFVRVTPRALARQYFHYGVWKVRVWQKHPKSMQPRHFVPPIAAGTAIAQTLATAAGWPSGGSVLAALVLVYAAIAGVMARRVAESTGTGGRGLVTAALLFPLVHGTYGVGFLVGLVRFAGRWREP